MGTLLHGLFVVASVLNLLLKFAIARSLEQNSLQEDQTGLLCFVILDCYLTFEQTQRAGGQIGVEVAGAKPGAGAGA